MTQEMSKEELIQLLDKEGDIAADYLEELLDIADLDGDIEISVEADRASLAIVTDGQPDRRLKRLIGRDGEVLEALQDLTRLAVQSSTGDRSRLMLDIAGYRAQRRQDIAFQTQEAIDIVKETRKAFALKPMNPFERKVVHDLAAASGIYSDSSGVGEERHVVLLPEPPVAPEPEATKVVDSNPSTEPTESAPSAESAE